MGKHIGMVLGGLLMSAPFALSANATPVNFNITGVSFTLDNPTGYGSGSSLLDVSFSTSSFSPPQNFNLNVGDSWNFLFGKVTLNEDNISSGETDHLGVTANFTFTNNPLDGVQVQHVTAVGTATTGDVHDPFFWWVPDNTVDYTLVWTPIIVPLGGGLEFEVSLGNLSFTDQDTKKLFATVTLLDPPEEDVPEPGTLALLGGGLIGLMYLRRRVQKT